MSVELSIVLDSIKSKGGVVEEHEDAAEADSLVLQEEKEEGFGVCREGVKEGFTLFDRW